MTAPTTTTVNPVDGITSFVETLFGGLMKNKTASKLMTVAMVITGALGVTGSSVANDILMAIGGTGFAAHVVSNSPDAV